MFTDAPRDLIEVTAPKVTAPNWGYALSTQATSITIEGIARGDVTSVTWVVASGGAAWGQLQTTSIPYDVMAKWTQPFCAPPDSVDSGSFIWQVAATPYGGWGVQQDDRFIFRVDLDDGDVLTPLAFSADWTMVSSLATGSGDSRSTGWQPAFFTINTPPATDALPVSVTFMTFGYDAMLWSALVDDLTWELQ